MESLLTVIVFVIIAIFSAWSQKRARGAEAEEVWTEGDEEFEADDARPAPPAQRGPQSPPAPASGRSRWEEELRRMLEGEAPRPRPQRPAPPPPPVIVSEGSGPFPATIPTARPARPAPYTRPEPRPQVVVAPGPARPATPVLVPRYDAYALPQFHHRKPDRPMETVADHFRHVGDHKLPSARVRSRRERSQEVNEVVTMFRDARSARKAVIASFILGPCKAVEERGT